MNMTILPHLNVIFLVDDVSFDALNSLAKNSTPAMWCGGLVILHGEVLFLK